ncbi:Nck-associated protein 5 [Myotis brandtii]|uniref:Nck-associated protein 5 n=1 Tax=Myotis brandtii TaxID=109478 RepID=S7PVZ2_MYOBR|nr:Nck-associated protein 5 [Myotis brandtii]
MKYSDSEFERETKSAGEVHTFSTGPRRVKKEKKQSVRAKWVHEKLIHELEEERHLRLQSEKRLQEVTLESERSRIQMRGLQQQFSR